MLKESAIGNVEPILRKSYSITNEKETFSYIIINEKETFAITIILSYCAKISIILASHFKKF